MADISTIDVRNIKSITIGTDVYKGINSAQIQMSRGAMRYSRDEDQQYAARADREPVDGAPVTVSFDAQSLEYFLTMVNLAQADVVILAEVAGGGTDQEITISNVNFVDPSANMGRAPGGRGSFNIRGEAVSADGSALPIAIADAA